MPDEVIDPAAAVLRVELDKMLKHLDDDVSAFEKKLGIVQAARTGYAEAKAAVAAAQAHPETLDAFGLDTLANTVTVALGAVSDPTNKVKSSGVLGAIEVAGMKGADQKLRGTGADLQRYTQNVAVKLGQWFNEARKLRTAGSVAMLEALRVGCEVEARAAARWNAGEGAFEKAWAKSEEDAGFKVGDPSRAAAKSAARKAAGGDSWDAAAAGVRVTDAEKYLKDRNKQLGQYVAQLAKQMNDELRRVGELAKMVKDLQGWGAWVESQKKRAAAAPAPVKALHPVQPKAPFAVSGALNPFGSVSMNIPRSSAPETVAAPAGFLFAFRRSVSRPGTWEVVIEPAAHWAQNHFVTDSYTPEEAHAIDAVFPGLGAVELYESVFAVPMGWTVAQLRAKLVRGGMRESEELRRFVISHQ